MSEVGRRFITAHVKAGAPAFMEMWNTHGGSERDRLDGEWLQASRLRMVKAVKGE